MALTPKEQFRMGFLLRCAEEGLTPDEVTERVKVANPTAWAAFGIPGLVNAFKAYASLPLHVGALGLGGAALAGPAVGYSLAKLNEDDVDSEEAKRQELIATYEQQAERVRRAMRRKRYRGQAPAAPKLF